MWCLGCCWRRSSARARRRGRRTARRDRRAERRDLPGPVWQAARLAACATSSPGTRCTPEWAARRGRRLPERPREPRARACCSGFGHSRGRRVAGRSAAVARGASGASSCLPRPLPVGARAPDLERGQPLRRSRPASGPGVAARYYDTLRRNCRGCTDRRPPTCSTRRDAALGAAVPRSAAGTAPDLGAAQLHRRQPLPHERHARAAARATKGEIWFTETGGLVRRNNGSRIEFPENEEARGQGDQRVFKLARAEPARAAGLLLPLDRRPAGRRRGTRRWSTRAAARARPTRSCCIRAACAPAAERSARGAGDEARGRSRSRLVGAAALARLRQREGDHARRHGRRHDADRLLAAARSRATARRRDMVDGEKLALAEARRDGRALTRSTSSRSTRAPGGPAGRAVGGRDARRDRRHAGDRGDRRRSTPPARAPRPAVQRGRDPGGRRSAPAIPGFTPPRLPGEPER